MTDPVSGASKPFNTCLGGINMPQFNGYLAYLATPYTNYQPDPTTGYVHACKIAAKLIRSGIKVYSPIAHTHPIGVFGDLDPLDHTIWLPFDEAMMAKADVLIVAHLNGWKESKGVKHEIAFFEAAAKPIYDLDPVTMAMKRRELVAR